MAAPPIAERHLHHFHRRSPIKESVRVATTANITIATALNNGDTLDGITLATDDRVLVKDQTAPAENGIYTVGVTPARAYDQSTDDPAFGFLVNVREGTVNASTLWRNTNTATPTIDTTALTFAVSAGGAPTTADYLVGTAQAGLSAEIVVGTTPGGELGGTWASPTVDATHSGSAHADFVAKAIVDAKGDIIAATAADTVARVAVGADGTFLQADSGAAAGVAWAAASGSGTVTTVKDEGVNLSTAVVSIDFVGAGVTATGTTAVTVTVPGGGGNTSGQFIFGFDGGGVALVSGKQQDLVAPFAGTITGWTMLGDQSGSAVVDLWKDTYANFPPTIADTITAAAKPTISGATKAQSSTLTGWTTAVAAGDIIRINLDSVATITRLLVIVAYSRP